MTTDRPPSRFGCFFATALTGIGLGLFSSCAYHLSDDRVTTTALSPNEELQAVLVEPFDKIAFDRNFVIKIGKSGRNLDELESVFRSPDEGRPIGSERLIWSKDSQYLLLVGRKFFAHEDAPRIKSGETLYLLIHVPSKRQWCNSRQGKFERFGFNDLASITFSETIEPAEPSVKKN